ncbi:MAG: DJ-1/PfpI family protein [Lentisphaeria bacterium]|nr:DJ-1/PfpI family protein [Lentisphaerota bacterium]MBR7144212.1 DJ-1/PfpI family protein [Lentisphaeria bacterium]
MKKVLILLAEGFEEIEALGTADILRRMGVEVVLASMKKTVVSGSHNIIVSADALFDDLEKNTFDAVVLPGGLPGSLNLYNDDRVIDILHGFAAENKVTAAICAAPMVLDKAGLLENRRFTMYPAEDLYKYLRDNKRPQSDMVVADGKVITGKGPGAAPYFAAAVAGALNIADDTIENVLAGMFVK